ncbi:MAG TPA: hypothetical protein VF335_08320 [Chitinivibrionales bacterium]
MIPPRKKYNYVVTLTAISICTILACSRSSLKYVWDPNHQLSNANQSALCLPFKNIRVDYIDNTKLRPDALYSDSFLVEAAGGLLMFEAMQRFRISPERCVDNDSIQRLERAGYSPLTGDTTLKILTSKRIAALAEKYSVDIVIVPYSCVIRQQTEQKKGWRGHNGPGYDRPVSFSASTTVTVQLWNRSGQLLYERIGSDNTGKPILYAALKKEKPDADIVKFAKKMYAPPLIKSLFGSITRAMQLFD